MSFLDFMSRMFEGKPVFDENVNPRADAQAAPQPGDQSLQSKIRKHDDSSFPVVHVKRTKTTVSGNEMQVYCLIENTWPDQVMLDKIRLCNTTRELDTYLSGHQAKDFLVYKGPKLTHEYHEALLDYKTQQEGDYFQAVHDVDFEYHPEDKTYTVSELELRRPIRDIYE